MLSPMLFLALACAPDLAEQAPVAEVATPPAPAPGPEAAPAAAPSGDPVPALTAATVIPVAKDKSKLHALGAKITATHPVDFHEFAGRVGLDGEKVSGVAFAATVASLESDHPKLTTHLKGEDFLWAEKHPHATFVSTEIAEGGAEGHTHTVTGDLTIRGVTKRVTFPATIAASAAEVTAKTEFVINRQDFGITYPGKADDLVQDNVILKIEFVAPRA